MANYTVPTDPEEKEALEDLITQYGDAAEAAMRLMDDVDQARSALEEGYRVGISREDIAEQYCSDMGYLLEVPEPLQSHINFQSFARNLEAGGLWHFQVVGRMFYCFY